MKLIAFPIVLILGVLNANAQIKTITADEYESVFNFAVRETNAAFPFVFQVKIEKFENGQIVSSQEQLNERQAPGVEQLIVKSRDSRGNSAVYQVRAGFGNVYCSEDGLHWEGPQPYECPRDITIYRRRDPEKATYSVEEMVMDGAKVKVYKEQAVFTPNRPGSNRTFKDTTATIDARGYFISIVNVEGTLSPKSTDLIRTQTWNFKTKFKPIEPPANNPGKSKN